MGAKGLRIDTSREAAVRVGGEEYAAGLWSELPRCPDCQRPMRPYKASSVEFPATVVRAGGGFCSTHYSARRARNTLPGDRKMDQIPIDPLSRRAISERWSAEERSVALLAADVVLRLDPVNDPVSDTAEMLDILGLFEEDPLPTSSLLRDPKGLAGGRY